ncbi:tetratricopeptide repeat protein [Candidatus Sumerlaeota bacterium]|nr:tetratricopeptide repeat protein [Candidatus Sumerlaeota bacterium]
MRIYILFACVLIAYSTSFKGGFILDDLSAIRENRTIRRLYPLSIPLTPPKQTSVSGRPLLNLSFALNYAISGLDVGSYHLFNLLIHAASALLVYGVIRRALRFFRNRFQTRADQIAFVSSLLWAVHPLQTESVAYIIQRAESLAGFFILGTLYCAVRSAETQKNIFWIMASVLSCALGILVKEVAAVAPLLVLSHDFLFSGDSWRGLARRRWMLYAGLFCSWAILPLVSFGERSGSAGFGAAGYGPIAYGITQIGVITHYLRLCFHPHPLVFDYAWGVDENFGDVIFPGILLGGLLFLTLWFFIRRSPMGFPGAWFFLILAPTSSIFPIHTEVAAERRMYLPLAAVVVSVVLIFCRFFDLLEKRNPSFKTHRSKAASMLAFLCVAILCVMTMERNTDYHDPEVLWKHVLEHQPQNSRAYLNLGIIYLEQGRKQDAIDIYEEALGCGIDTTEGARVHANLAHLLLDQDQFEKAWEHYEKAVVSDPEGDVFMNYFGIDLGRRGRIREAETAFRKALEANPRNYSAHNNLGKILEILNKKQEARKHYEEALRLKPDWEQVRKTIDRLNQEMGKGEQPDSVTSNAE